MVEIKWSWKTFDELSTKELYEFMVLRQEVFVVEQSCHYLDADGKDVDSFHLMGYEGDNMVAYARIVKPGISYVEVAIGRVVTAKSVRGQGIGITLMNKTLEHIALEYGDVPVRLSAQTYLLKYYEKYGFKSTGKEYYEDEIPHTEMLKP